MTHKVEKWSAFPTKYYTTFPQLILFIPQSSVMASSTTVKINKFNFFGLTCHIFCFFKSILNSPTNHVQTAVLKVPWQRRRRKVHTFSLLCSAPSLDNTGWSSLSCWCPRAGASLPATDGTARLYQHNSWPSKLSSAFTSAKISVSLQRCQQIQGSYERMIKTKLLGIIKL